ncbi:MAG: hydroxyacylglutathione hydrolase [Alphaproteobacteria bacterium]
MTIIPLPLLKDNYAYLLHCPHTSETAIIDPSESAPVIEELDKRGLKLTYIINTHHHHDHVGGNEEIKKHTDCQVVCSYTDRNRVPGADISLKEGDIFKLGQHEARIMEIPGHTIGHMALWFIKDEAVFVGDTLFSLGCGRMFEGTPEQMWNSLRRLADLPRTTKVYCGHEYTRANGRFALDIDPHNPALKDYYHQVQQLRDSGKPTVPSTIEIEVETNPFLRAPLLVGALGLGENVPPHEAFAAMRHRKDHYIDS